MLQVYLRVYGIMVKVYLRVYGILLQVYLRVYGIMLQVYLRVYGIMLQVYLRVYGIMLQVYLRVNSILLQVYLRVNSILLQVYLRVYGIMLQVYLRVYGIMLQVYLRVYGILLQVYLRVYGIMVKVYLRVYGIMLQVYLRVYGIMLQVCLRVYGIMLQVYLRVYGIMLQVYLRVYGIMLQVKKGKPDSMESILKGILASDHSDSMKQDLLTKIARQGAYSQTQATVLGVLELTSHWVLEGDSPLHQRNGIEIYKAWARGHATVFEQFFTREFLLTLMSKKYQHDEKGLVGVLLAESMKVLQTTASFRNLCTIVEAKATAYVKEHPYIDCLAAFADFLLEFKECIPKGDIASAFCAQLIWGLSLCSPPESGNNIVTYIKNVNTVANLFSYMWDTPDSPSLQESLKEIFRIISMPCDVEPSLCLGSLVPFIPPALIPKVGKSFDDLFCWYTPGIAPRGLLISAAKLLHFIPYMYV